MEAKTCFTNAMRLRDTFFHRLRLGPCRLTPLLTLLVLECIGCNWSDQPMILKYRRPDNVPSDASLVELAKGGVWQRC